MTNFAANVRPSPETNGRLIGPSQVIASEYEACERRALICSLLMGLDQKILHLPPTECVLHERKRGRFFETSDKYKALSGVGFVPPQPNTDSREELKQMKLSILQTLRAAPLPQVDRIQLNVMESEDGVEGRFGYVQELRNIFRDNLRGVVLYGSATFSETPGDYDNYIIVDDIGLAYEKARSINLKYLNRPVHLNLIPADLAVSILTLAAMPSVRAPWLRVLYGTVVLPELPDRIVYMQGRARALELFDRRAQLIHNDCDALVDRLVQMKQEDREALFKAVAYLPAVMVEWTRLFGISPSNTPLTKAQILKNIEHDGFELPVCSDNPSILTNELFKGLFLANALLKRANDLPFPIGEE